MSNLGSEIKRLRLAHNWNQISAAAKCGINPSLFSRLESGKIETPTLETMAKLAQGFGVDREKFDELIGRQRKTMRVGFAHAIWAAPVIALVMERPFLKDVSLTSYGSYQRTGLSAHNPHWYDANAKPHVGPNFDIDIQPGNERRMLPEGYIKWPEESKHSIYTAGDLDYLLKAGEIDCLVAAKHVFSDHDEILVRCARIMDCVGGGSSILIWDGESGKKFAKRFEDFSNDSVMMQAQFMEAINKGSRLPIYFGQGTSGEKTLDFFGDAIQRFCKRPVPFGDWPLVLEQLDEAIEKEGAFLLLAWEPIISAVKSRYQREGKKWITRLHLSNEKPMPYISFDIMFRKEDAKRWAKSDVAASFLTRIRHHVRTLKRALTDQNFEAGIVRSVSSYLNMDNDRCMNVLSHLDFDLLYYPEWLEIATARGDATD